MFVHRTFWMWTTGNFSTSATVPLNAGRRYLVTGGIVGREGAEHGQVYTATVCTLSGDQVLCGIRDDPADTPDTMIKDLGLLEVLPPGSTRVTVKLRSRGGRHRAEGIVYDIT